MSDTVASVKKLYTRLNESIDKRFDRIDEKFDDIFDSIAERIDEIEGSLEELDERLQERVVDLESKIDKCVERGTTGKNTTWITQVNPCDYEVAGDDFCYCEVEGCLCETAQWSLKDGRMEILANPDIVPEFICNDCMQFLIEESS